ncbi:hypothetical protein A2U01_0056032, partial [Trifolium medium]|nr:hypothetical protein [Trifolium medium]
MPCDGPIVMVLTNERLGCGLVVTGGVSGVVDGRHPQGVDRHACVDRVNANNSFSHTIFDYSNYLIFRCS